MTSVLLTDFAWPDDAVERAVIEEAGYSLVTGPSVAGTAADVESLVRSTAPSAIMTCWAPVSAAAIDSAPDLKIVARLGVGLDTIDVAATTAKGAWVTNVPDYCVEEVSDHAVGLLLAWARGIVSFDRSVKVGSWSPAEARLTRVRDLTVGILGFGRIGRRTARKLGAWNLRVIAHNRSAIADHAGDVEAVPFAGFLAKSDVVIIHAPLTAETRGLFDDRAFSAMKPNAYLINVSRGGVVDNGALLHALESGRLAGAALDVVEGEPDPPRELVGRPDVIVTPHVAFSSTASLIELRRRGAEEVVRVLRGAPPLHPCNNPAGRP